MSTALQSGYERGLVARGEEGSDGERRFVRRGLDGPANTARGFWPGWLRIQLVHIKYDITVAPASGMAHDRLQVC